MVDLFSHGRPLSAGCPLDVSLGRSLGLGLRKNPTPSVRKIFIKCSWKKIRRSAH
ncbi:Hypothetical protein PSEBR_m1629 [Pseudomonas brassicacearum subsp. brassicacearum NFM421]|uniref:Uncharacterized protein n=1 Tax=Pseudomonas brassicacearum (strain NFM421) TaxID=994484 RepID=F2KMC0_PSEBN|nr:Hypothetical protein PSEBR_m1629 [Pseudomonas brassicacearum subsp. brassicacearum NFM421]